MSERRISQQTIADMLNLSRSTVTKVLNHDPVYRVSEETRELILRTARDVRFTPRRRRTGNVAFIVCGEIHSATHETHQALCAEADQLGYRVFLVGKPRNASYREISLSVNPLAADGAIIVGETEPETVRKLAEVMPAVWADSDSPVEGVDTVIPDVELMAERLMDRLLQCGHRHIAVISHDVKNDSRYIRGCRRALERAGIEFDRSLVWGKLGRIYPELVAEIISHPARPTAILAFTTSDHALILATLYALGRRVPEDMSYVGWALSYFSGLAAFPEITCLEDYHQNVARTALRRLLNRMEERSLPVENITVETKIHPGKTCAMVSTSLRHPERSEGSQSTARDSSLRSE